MNATSNNLLCGDCLQSINVFQSQIEAVCGHLFHKNCKWAISKYCNICKLGGSITQLDSDSQEHRKLNGIKPNK